MSVKKEKKAAASNGSAAGKVTPASATQSSSDKSAEGNVTSKAAEANAPLSPEAKEKIAELRGKIQASVGQAVLAMMNLPRYRSQTLGDLTHLVIEPLLRDRLAIASTRSRDDKEGSAPAETLAGIAIWASVSDAIDTKIREQIKGGAFPVRLSSEDWTSGEKLWLLDVIAPNRKLATAVLANFSHVAKDRPVAIHPIVARSVDPEVLEKMRTKPAADESALKLSEDTETKGEA